MTDTLKSYFSVAPPTDKYMETLFHQYSEAGEAAGSDSYKMFNNRWMPYAYAAFLGISVNRREKLEPPLINDRFKFEVVFNQNRDYAHALILAALSQCNEFEDIMDRAKIMSIISEYAKGGAMQMEEYSSEGKFNFASSEGFLHEIMNREEKL
jgi:hypothetical protein